VLTGARFSTEEPAHHQVETLIDVWCEAPVDPRWEEVANSATDQMQRIELWGGVEYWFVLGAFFINTDEHSRALFTHTTFLRRPPVGVVLFAGYDEDPSF